MANKDADDANTTDSNATHSKPRRGNRSRGGARPRALVTGASSGIGEAFAEHLARRGHDLTIVARRADRLESLAKRLEQCHGVEVEVFPADLIQAGELRSVEDKVASDPELELLVNNAGFGTAGRLAELPPDGEESEIRLNVLALVRLTRAALPAMLTRGRGGIINVSSMASFSPAPFMATYAATKAFVNAFTEGVADEVAGSGVKLQALCPGFTRTEFQDTADVDPGAIPQMAWMEAGEVVEASLAGLERGTLVVVPGLANRLAVTSQSWMPRSLVRRLTGSVLKRSVAGRGGS